MIHGLWFVPCTVNKPDLEKIVILPFPDGERTTGRFQDVEEAHRWLPRHGRAGKIPWM